jgi:serine/threonine-protein kinase
MGLESGQVIDGKYRIVRLLGEGGMGAVYEGENVRIHRRVAIKVLHAGVAGNADAVQRFEREAQAAGRIGSDHIVEVLDLGNLPEGDRYMVMEYLDGESLSHRIQKRGRLEPNEAAPLLLQLLDGLVAAHGAGIIHRDLKPDNVFLLRSRKGQGDFVKILDFGISKFNSLNADSGMSMTRTGAVMGTPFYMSPEQAKGSKQMDHRSDLYSAGVILYESVTGQVPFNADTFNELLFKIVLETAAPPERHAPGLDPTFSAIVQKAMGREPNDRFQSAAEFAAVLEGWIAAQGLETGKPGLPLPRPPAPSAPMIKDAPLAATLAHTPAPWSQTGATAPAEVPTGPPAKKNKKLAVASMAGVVVLGFVSLFGMRALRGSAVEVSPTPPSAPAAAAAPPNAMPAATPSPEPPAAPATEPHVAEPSTSADRSAPPVPSPSKKGAPLVGKRPSAKPAGPGAATAPAAPPVAATPAEGSGSGGRKIRTEL